MTFCLTKSYLVICLALFLSFLPVFTCFNLHFRQHWKVCADALWCEKHCSVLFCCGLIPVGPQPSARSSHTTAQFAAHSSSPKISSPHSVMLPSGSVTGQGISSLFGLLCLLMCRHVVMGQHLVLFMYVGVGCIFWIFRINQPAVRNWICAHLYALSECVLFIGKWAKLLITHHKLIIYNEQLSIIFLILLLWNIRLS